MRDPYTTSDGYSYERVVIEQWLTKNETSPMTGSKLQSKNLIPAITLRNSIEEWRNDRLKNIQIDELALNPVEIGRGRRKMVFQGTWSCPGAITKIRRVAVSRMISGSCEKEAMTFIRIGRHPRIVRFYGVYVHGGFEHMVTEIAKFGALVPDSFKMIGNNGWKFTLGHALAIMQQVCCGMEALAAADIVHRDLAGRNILLFAFDPHDATRTSAKVSNLSLSTYACHEFYIGAAVDAPSYGTVRLIAPEVLERGLFSEPSDVWAMGVLCWEVLTCGQKPFDSCGLIAPDDVKVLFSDASLNTKCSANSWRASTCSGRQSAPMQSGQRCPDAGRPTQVLGRHSPSSPLPLLVPLQTVTPQCCPLIRLQHWRRLLHRLFWRGKLSIRVKLLL
jgi:serine/threonine protein kinase